MRKTWPQFLALALTGAAAFATPAPGRLQEAARQGRLEELEALVAQGAEINAPGERGWTALHQAVVSNQGEAARLLLERGADPNARGQLDMTPLHWAALLGHAELAKLLLARGANVMAKNLYGMSPLHEAANEAVARVLLDAGAGVKVVDDYGMTPLHLARSKAVGVTLMEAGADLQARSRDGRDLFEMAVMTTMEREGLVFYGRRVAVRLKEPTARVQVAALNVSSKPIERLSLEAQSEACTALAQPEEVPTLAPGQLLFLELLLKRKDGVAQEEFPLLVGVRAEGRRLGEFDLSVDTSFGTTPEDLGMRRLGRVNVRQSGSRWYLLLLGGLPLGALAVFLWWRRKR